MKVYGDRRSGNCYKIQLICALLDLKYQWIDVDILKGETSTSNFLDKNPNGKIPLLELDDGRVIIESNAIVNYLAYGSVLLPTEQFSLAMIQQWQFFEQYSHEPNIAVARFIEKYLGLPKSRQVEYQSKHQAGYKALSVMEQQLAKSKFIAGNTITTADISLYAYTHVADEGGFDLSPFPNISRWLSCISAQSKYCPMI